MKEQKKKKQNIHSIISTNQFRFLVTKFIRRQNTCVLSNQWESKKNYLRNQRNFLLPNLENKLTNFNNISDKEKLYSALYF